MSSASLSRFWSSIPETVRSGCLILIAIAIALVGWSGEPRLLPAAMLLPALWAMAPTRLSAALVAAGYFLAASRGLPQGVANFYDSGFADGIALWIAASILFVLTHALLWTNPSRKSRVIRYAIIAVLLSVPPIGIVGWAHPITAAGILFPGWKWTGLAAATVGLLVMTTRFRVIAALTLGTFWFLSIATWTDHRRPDGWSGVDTAFGGGGGRYADYQQHLANIDRVLDGARDGISLIVLPESALGIWTPTIERLWISALADIRVTVYGGAVIVDESGYDNVMIELSERGAVVRYRQRMPVPVSMWQPWHSLLGAPAGARADLFANPVVPLSGLRVGTLVCYEQLLIWPVLHSALVSAEVLVAPVNGWWTDETDIVATQMATMTAWTLLFDLPLVVAINI